MYWYESLDDLNDQSIFVILFSLMNVFFFLQMRKKKMNCVDKTNVLYIQIQYLCSGAYLKHVYD